MTVNAHFLEAGMLNRHPMRIPARCIGSIKTAGIFILQDDVLEDLIEGMAKWILPLA